MGGWTWPPFVKPRSRVEGEDSGGAVVATWQWQAVRPTDSASVRRYGEAAAADLVAGDLTPGRSVHRVADPDRRGGDGDDGRMGKLSRGIRSRLGDQPASCATVPLFRHEQCQTDSSLGQSSGIELSVDVS